MEYIEEFDKLKTKVLKYVLYKKRTEKEVIQKFQADSGELLNEVISELKELGYIDDETYIKKAIKEYMSLKNMSIKEIEYKLIAKGIKRNIIDEYIYNNREEMVQYEITSAKNIFFKKENLLDKEDIINYLKQKGYLQETINIALEKD